MNPNMPAYLGCDVGRFALCARNIYAASLILLIYDYFWLLGFCLGCPVRVLRLQAVYVLQGSAQAGVCSGGPPEDVKQFCRATAAAASSSFIHFKGPF